MRERETENEGLDIGDQKVRRACQEKLMSIKVYNVVAAGEM